MISSRLPVSLSFLARRRTQRVSGRLAALLLLSGVVAAPVGQVQAQSQWSYGCDRQGEAQYCYRPFAEGLAAVQLGEVNQRKPVWGYLALDGSIAIAPAFDDAESFQNGLAAVESGGRWGYIDRQGQWAIEPRFDEAWGFNAEGSALASLDDRDVLIDRTGKILKTFPAGTRTWGFDAGQSLAMMEQASAPSAWNIATGQMLTVGDDVASLESRAGRSRWHSNDWIAAQSRDSRYGGQWGLLKRDGSWLVKPEVLQSELAPQSDGRSIAVSRDNQWLLTDMQAKPDNAQPYRTLSLLAPGYWLGTRNGVTELLGPDRQPMRRWNKAPHIERPDDQNYAVVWDGAGVLILNDGQPHILLEQPHQSVKVSGNRVWVFKKPADTGNASESSYRPPEVLAQVYDLTGRPLLDLAEQVPVITAATEDETTAPGATAEAAATAPQTLTTAQRLEAYSVDILTPQDNALEPVETTQWPLAILKPRNYADGLPPMILTAAGRLVTAPTWQDIRYSREGGPLLVRLQGDRVGVIDAQGNWLLQPEFGDMDLFQGPYARARPVGSDRYADFVLIDRHGQPVTLPADVRNGMERLEGSLVRYRVQDSRGDNRWFLWDIAAAKPVMDSFQSLSNYSDGYAQAQQKGKWGLLNRQGKWAVPPTLQSSPYVRVQPGGFILLQDEDDSSQARLLRPDGKQVGPLLSREVQHLGRGQFLVTLAQSGEAAVLDTARGTTTPFSQAKPSDLSHDRAWVIARGDFRRGAVDSAGKWRVAPTLTEFNPFFAHPSGLARVTQHQDYYLIDEQGKRVLPDQADLFPVEGMARIVRHGDDGYSALLDMKGKEITRVEGSYALETDEASEGLLPYRQPSSNKYGFMDADGKRVIGAYFDSLGPMRNGLAVAMRRDRAGKFQGYIDRTGRYAILPEFTWASDFSDNRALVHRDRLVQYIDQEGKAIAYLGVLCGYVSVISPADEVLWPGQDKLGCLTDAKQTSGTLTPPTGSLQPAAPAVRMPDTAPRPAAAP